MIAADALRGVSLFEGLSERELEQIAQIAREEVYEPEARIFAEGALADNLYILLTGEVDIRISLNSESPRFSVDTVNIGEVFGWSALTEPHSMTAGAYTKKQSTVVVMPADRLLDLFRNNNYIGYQIMRKIGGVISSRLKQSRESILALLHQRS